MKISGIDKDFVDIIEYLNENGYKTFASCDGVLEHHADDIVVPSSAYISFLKSPKIIDLMAQFAKDKDKFIIGYAGRIADNKGIDILLKASLKEIILQY